MKELEKSLRRTVTPAPPPGLRERVLTAARAARAHRSIDPHPLDRLWDFRQALVAGLLALALAHLAVTSLALKWEREWGWIQPTPWNHAAWMAPIEENGR